MTRLTAPKLATAALALAGGLSLAACTQPGTPAPGSPMPPSTALTAPEWVVDIIAGSGTVPQSQVTLDFDEDGSVGGRGSCNHYTAQYQRTGEALTISQATSTMMACAQPLMEQERRFLDTLQATIGYEIDESTGSLILHTADGRTIQAHPA